MASATAFSAPGAGVGAGGGRGSRPCAVAAVAASATPAAGLGVAPPATSATSPGRRSSASGGPPGGGSTSATISSANKSRSSAASAAFPGGPGGGGPAGPVSTGLRPGRIVRKKTATQQVVQWKTRNVQEGIVLVDETQLSRLIKRDPIDKFYDMDPEPFATGMFASVRRCRSRDTGIQLAAKFSSRLRYGADCSAEIHHEIALLSLCSPSPRVIKLHDVFQTDAEIILVMEYAPGGDLQTLIDDNIVPYESDVVTFSRQLVEGLAYLHQRKIAHLDIKPQNLVMMGDFPDCDVKLCDFEISRVILEGTEIREILGTPDYVAPEILHYEPITMAADMWSLGVTVYVLLTGFSPFGGETDQETFCNISRAQLDFPEELFEDVSPEAQDFIRRLLQRDPRSRPTAKECLRHPWLSQRAAEGVAGRTRSCASCSTVPPNSAPNLRKYLSKSREALFERVLQRGGSVGGGLLGTARAARAGPGGRLCESQMSLVSKSREREMQAALVAMSPSLSRSREKLYGLRSLSRSQEVLAMCRALPVLRTLTRATTADLSELGVGPGAAAPRVRLHTSVGSELDTLPDLEDESEPLSGSFSTPATPAPTAAAPPPPLERAISTPANATPAVATPGPTTFTATSSVTLATKPVAAASALTSTLTPKIEEPPAAQSRADANPDSPLDTAPATVSANTCTTSPSTDTPTALPTARTAGPATAPPTAPDGPTAAATTGSEPEPDVEAEAEAILNALRRGLLARGSPTLPALLAPLMVAAATSSGHGAVTNGGLGAVDRDRQFDAEPTVGCRLMVAGGAADAAATTGLQREQSTLSSHSESSESTLEGDDDGQGLNDEDLNEDELQDEDSDAEQQAQQQQGQQDEQQEQEEPRFTVQQLITAYNLHDEVVTKSSLDFTMATKATKAADREVKLPAQLPLGNGSAGGENKSKFPTGPNALRLFIPDIDITNAKPRKTKVKTSKAASATAIERIEEEPDGEQQSLARLSPDAMNNNINTHINNNIENSSILADAAKLVIRVDDVSEPLPVKNVAPSPTPVTAPADPPEPPPPPPPPLASFLEPKKSPKTVRPSTAAPAPPTAPSNTSSTSSASSVQRHRRSASTPSSEPYSRSAGVSPSPSPSPSPSKAGAGRGANHANGVLVHRSSSGAGSGSGTTRKSSAAASGGGSGTGTGSSHSTSEKLRRKSTPVFK